MRILGQIAVGLLRPLARRTLGVGLALMMIVALSLSGTTWGGDTGLKAIRRDRATEGIKSESLKKGDLYALVVGVSNYANPAVPKLNLSAKDARDFADFIETQRKVFRNTYVKGLFDEQATKQEVEKYLYGELRKAGKDDSIILFFSGHGGSDPGDPGAVYFLTYDADPKYLHATAINMAGLKFLDRLDCKRALVIADACHAGGFSKIVTKSIEPPMQKWLEMVKESSGIAILSSSQPHEYSQERPNLPNSVFTYYLLKGLKGEADIQRSGVITLQEVYDYVYDRTKSETEGAQHPKMESSVAGRFPISVLERLEGTLHLDVRFVAQDPGCSNPDCIDPPPGATECKDPKCGDITITNESVMYSGQNYQIGFRPNETSYVYVYQVDSNGAISRLFPGTDYLEPTNRMENPLKPDRIYWIPGRDAWLRLDDQQGEERIYVIASRSRNAPLEDLYKEMETIRKKGGEDTESRQVNEETRETVERIMGVSKAVVRKIPSGSQQNGSAKARSFEEFSRAMESTQLDVAESVRFFHKGRQAGRQ